MTRDIANADCNTIMLHAITQCDPTSNSYTIASLKVDCNGKSHVLFVS